MKVLVKNQYRASASLPKFNWINSVEDRASFYEVYGDKYIADVVEGGLFIGVVSIITRSFQETLDVKLKWREYDPGERRCGIQ